MTQKYDLLIGKKIIDLSHILVTFGNTYCTDFNFFIANKLMILVTYQKMYNKKNSRSVKRNLSKKAKWHNRTTRGFKNMQNRKIKGRERCS